MFSKTAVGAALLSCALFAIPAAAQKKSDRIESDERSELRAQVLLDRAGFSPGPIDGSVGENTRRALRAFQEREDLPVDGKLSTEVWEILSRGDDTPALIDYNISKVEAKSPFADEIPRSLEDQGDLDELSYTSTKELIAEKFHMDAALLESLNPKADFDEAGATIKVANVGERLKGKSRKVARLDVDKEAGAIRAYDADDRVVAFYPASVGSREIPSPRGSLEITKISRDPTYTYDPDELDLKEVKTKKKFTIAAGPNNPIGSAWIGLDKEGYGIHGTPEPEDLNEEQSLGCVRLTNWDALELAGLVRPGVPVKFTTGSKRSSSKEE